MKFFKHFVDSDQGSLGELMNDLGVEGYGRYWLLTSLCVATLEKPRGEAFTEDDMKFTFNERQLREKLRIKSVNLRNFLEICSELALFQWEQNGNKFNFYFPNILKSMDRDSKRARTVRATTAPKIKNKIKNKIYTKESDCDVLFEIWNKHSGTLPKAELLTAKRRKHAKERWREKPDLDYWVLIAEKLAASDFCTGQTGGTWIADFDFMLKPDTHVKVFEGRYDNRNSSHANSHLCLIGEPR